MCAVLSFRELTPGVAVGGPTPVGWQPLSALPVVVVVGVTGVGKSTTLGKLAKVVQNYSLLPNRRELTDWLIIATLQAADGEAIALVTDRSRRFAYTRRYRQQFPGGMSHALSQLSVDSQGVGRFLLFDGLRGADEVGHAVAALPKARFVVLHAPDGVRIQRLLTRQDSFDATTVQGEAASGRQLESLAQLGLTAAHTVLTAAEQATLLALVNDGEVSAEDLRAKAQIVLEERRNYDPYAAIAYLQSQAPERTLVVDTAQLWPEQVVSKIVEQLRAWDL
jgi:hypothetical protein